MSEFDITRYGASTSSADNSGALHEAVQAAARVGGTVLVPAGEFRVGDTTYLQGDIPLRLRGAGPASALRMTSPRPALRLRDAGHEVRSLAFSADVGVSDGKAIVVEGSASGSRVVNCRFMGIPASAVLVQAGNRDSRIVGNVIEDAGRGGSVKGADRSALRAFSVEGLEISSNVLRSGPFKGIDLGPGQGPCAGVRVLDNAISNFGNIGIGMGSATDTLIRGNHVTDCGDNGIDCNDLAGLGHAGTLIAGNVLSRCKDGVFVGHGAHRVTVTGNLMADDRTGVRILDGAHHIALSGNVVDGTTESPCLLVLNVGGTLNRRPHHVVATGNIFRGSAVEGIRAEGCDHVRLVGNAVEGPRAEAVVADDTTHLSVLGNELSAVGAGRDGNAAVHVDASSYHWVVAHNGVAGGADVLFDLQGATSGRLESNAWDARGGLADIQGAAPEVADWANAAFGGQPGLLSGPGSPEGRVEARPGSLYLRTDGGRGTTLYVKETGTGRSGWAAK